jgi:signal peptidase I
MNTERLARPALRAFAGLLELVLFPGTGHYALGVWRQGIVWFALNIAVWAGLIAAGVAASKAAFWLAILVGVALRLAGAVDCYRQRERPRPPWRNVLVMSVLVAGGSLLGSEAVDEHVLDVLLTPSASMYPTLSPGDRIVVSKLDHELRRGNLVVFRSPEDPEQLFVKRIIALPGETVRMDGRSIVVDRKPFAHARLDAACHVGPDCELWEESSDAHRCKIALSRVPAIAPSDQPLRVPDESVFVLGDNRDDSLDSRVFGPVPLSDVVGKVQFTWLSASVDGARRSRFAWANRTDKRARGSHPGSPVRSGSKSAVLQRSEPYRIGEGDP